MLILGKSLIEGWWFACRLGRRQQWGGGRRRTLRSDHDFDLCWRECSTDLQVGVCVSVGNTLFWLGSYFVPFSFA